MSYKEGRYPIYSYTKEEKDDIRKELGLNEDIIQEDIDALTVWFEKQPHLIAAGVPDRDFFERMLIFAKGSREKTKKRIDNFYKYRSLSPEIFENRIELLDSDQSMWGFYRQAISPKLFELKRVSVLQFFDPDANNFDSNAVMRNSIIFGDLKLKYEYTLGDIWVLDITNAGLGHLLRINAFVMQKATQIFQDGMGVRIFGIHILGASGLVQHIVKFFRAFVKPKIMDRVMFHESLEDLHNYVPKKYLPLEYGGELLSMNESVESYRKLLRSDETKQYLLECNKIMSDESKRPDRSIHDEYLAGSFKKLDLD